MLKKMKFFIMALVVILSLSACGKETSSTQINDDYEEYNKYLAECLESAKTDVRTVLHSKDFASALDWGKLDKLDKIRLLAPDEVFSRKESEDEAIWFLSMAVAEYCPDEDTIYMYPNSLNYENGEEFYYCVLHEVCHSLINSEVSMLNEGETDYLAMQVAEACGIEPNIAYIEATNAVVWLHDIYGQKEIIEALRSNTIKKLIDGDIKAGSYEKLNDAISNSADGDTKGIRATVDLLYELSKNKGKEDIGQDWLIQYTDVYASVGISF
jgi:hypothetical protein